MHPELCNDACPLLIMPISAIAGLNIELGHLASSQLSLCSSSSSSHLGSALLTPASSASGARARSRVQRSQSTHSKKSSSSRTLPSLHEDGVATKEAGGQIKSE